MSFFKKGNKSENRAGEQKTPNNVPMATDEKTRQEIAEKNIWMSSKKRHIDVYNELAFSVAQWRLATFTMMILLVFSVLSNFSLAKSVKVQPYVIQVDQHGYAIPIKQIDPSGIDERVISAQIGSFIINSRVRVLDPATQLVYSQNSYKSVAAESSAARLLNVYYTQSPPVSARYSVSVKILSVEALTNKSYQASWTETVHVAEGSDEEFGFLGTFSMAVSPPDDFARLMDNPLGIYITDYNIIRSY